VSVIFWISLLIVAYVYFLYPVILFILTRGRRRPSPAGASAFHPQVTLIVAAHNEEKVIEEKLKNLLSLRYPRDRLDILIASDGSTDRTNQIVRSHAKEGVELRAYDRNRGKMAMFNELIPQAAGELVVISDADALCQEDALERLVANFADHTVGCATCSVQYINVDVDMVRVGEGLYQRYENLIRAMESSLGSTVIASGHFFAIRKSLFHQLPLWLSDDALMSLITIRAGHRVIADLGVRVYTRAAISFQEEFWRKVRMVTRQLGTLRYAWDILFRYGAFSWEYISHKLLRWLVPFFLVALFVANIFLASESAFYLATLVAQALFYLAAVVGYLARKAKQRVPLLNLPLYFCTVNLAAMIGTFNFLLGRQYATWRKAESSR